MLRSKIKNARRKLQCSSLEAPHREESNGGIANVIGPKLRLPEAKKVNLTLLRMRRTLSNIFVRFLLLEGVILVLSHSQYRHWIPLVETLLMSYITTFYE